LTFFFLDNRRIATSVNSLEIVSSALQTKSIISIKCAINADLNASLFYNDRLHLITTGLRTRLSTIATSIKSLPAPKALETKSIISIKRAIFADLNTNLIYYDISH
jgi:hypothetical protein